MPRLSLGLGVDGSGRIAPAAPSGIPVASTASVTVAGFTGGNTTYNGTYTKGTSGGFDPTITTPPTDGEVYIKGINTFVLLPPSVTIGGNNSYDGDDYPYSFGPQGNWTISRTSDDGEGATSLLIIATNASSNNDYIPTTGWSPSITITAAPGGIPVATTSSVIVAGSPDGANGTYAKRGPALWDNPISDWSLVWDSIDAAIPNRWSLYNSDTNAIVTHQTWSDQTQIPMSGWPNGETITAA